MKILVSGGHLTPALAFIDYGVKNRKDNFVFVGRTYSQTQLQQKSQEESEVKLRGVKFISFDSGKITHFAPLQIIRQSLNFFTSLWRAWHIFQVEQPDVFVSFGGYLAAPLTLVAFLRHTPIVTHEQTRTAGFANRFIAFFADAIAVSYPETAVSFPSKKTSVTGNPLRATVLNTHPALPKWLVPPIQKPILYITGGSQGSQLINVLVEKVIEQLLKDWCVIHQCGHPNSVAHYKQDLERKKKTLPTELQRSYYIREWLTAEELAWVYGNAKCIVGRAGANTVHELTMRGKPAIFIPLPFTHGEEQLKNAQAVVNAGAALLLPQKNLDASTFLKTLSQFKREYASLQRNAERNALMWERHADQKLYELVEKVVQKKHT